MALSEYFGIGTAGNNGVECRVYVSISDQGNNTSIISAEVQFRKNNGYASQGNTGGSLTIHGNGAGGGVSGNKTLPANGAWVAFAVAGNQTITHNADGTAPYTEVRVNGIYMSGSQDFDTAVSGTLGFNSTNGFADYTVLPYPPFNLTVRAGSVTTTSFGVDYTRSTYDGVDQDEVQWATDPDFTNVVWTHNPGGGGNGSAGYSNPAGVKQLTPGTTHYVRARSHTGAGWGGYSGAISQVTLPAVPPGLAVASSPSGAQAVLTFSPPGGVTGVSKYSWERVPTGTVGGAMVGDSATITTTVDGLTPGASYDWRASAWIGAYQSPWTGWVTAVQAKPNINPGDYFDGSTAGTDDLDYSWSGAPDGSPSVATASGVEGWQIQGGGAVLYRVTAGLFATYAARAQVIVDTTVPTGLQVGQARVAPYLTDVTPGVTYIGSIYVRPSRSQRLAVELAFLSSTGAYIASTYGAGSVVAGGTWARLIGGGVAPAGAVTAYVQALDVDGTGWSVWHGGDTLDLDGAMISLDEAFPYFDGDTPTDGTFFYQWTDEPNASTSTRTPLDSLDPSLLSLPGAPQIGARALLDPNCLPPAPPRPPTIPTDCITEIGVWRRTMQAIPAASVPDYLDAVPTFEITTISLEASQVRIRVLPNPDNLPLASFDATTGWISEQIISYIPKNTVLTIDGVHQRVQASVAGGPIIAADHLLYGSNGTPATWPVLSCGIPYVITADLPVEIEQGDSRLHTSLTTRY